MNLFRNGNGHGAEKATNSPSVPRSVKFRFFLPNGQKDLTDLVLSASLQRLDSVSDWESMQPGLKIKGINPRIIIEHGCAPTSIEVGGNRYTYSAKDSRAFNTREEPPRAFKEFGYFCVSPPRDKHYTKR
ncbi:hypothetical protein HOF78_01750 [Candidatus Woesearchaeota archaeon]|jgi:hypothetical protein|nr:hypothetical protein [Candidatus Woesearchaeota archaeon]